MLKYIIQQLQTLEAKILRPKDTLTQSWHHNCLLQNNGRSQVNQTNPPTAQKQTPFIHQKGISFLTPECKMRVDPNHQLKFP